MIREAPGCNILDAVRGRREFRGDARECRALVVVAHPDDESLGAGGQLRRLPRALFLYTTDGAPRDLRDALRAGYSTRETYAAARRAELLSALALAGFGPDRVLELRCADQESAYHLEELALGVRAAARELAPDCIVTHAYEGGHPDHDATAFAVHAACRLLQAEGRAAPPIIEFPSYHKSSGGPGTGEFLPGGVRVAITCVLSAEERTFKERLLGCFRTQEATIRALGFSTEAERFRLAPRYRFTRPPHDGGLFYEAFDWGVTGARWREMAARALAFLRVPGEA